ncbi:MAG TPA: amino acid permease [Legionellaceae bacterium]|nr:amino acid permease [Legionellaceae bacterium]
MTKKIGFWSVFALVTGSQIGSGIFMLPASLAAYGKYSIWGWLLSGMGAICLALVFAGLCNRFPRTGGPHAYVKEMFGLSPAFFTGWTYWVISWVSTTAVIIASISYLSPFIGVQPPWVYLLLEILLLLGITYLNLKGIQAAGSAEFVLTILKIIPLFLLPLIAIWYFNAAHFTLSDTVAALPLSSKLSQVMLLTLWGFIGLETATTPAGSVHNPSKTIPKAIVLGTLCTALLYLMSSVGIMGLVPGEVLAASKAPYVEASQYLFGGNWHLLIAIMAAVVCVGTLNAWMLASGQIVLGLAEDQLMPESFAKKNSANAPVLGLLSSAFGILPLLFLTMNASIAQQITAIIDFSVVAFLFVYVMCILAYIKALLQEKAQWYHWIYSISALIFCAWVISQTSSITIGISFLFVISGLPVYFFWYRRRMTTIQSNVVV